MIIRLPHALLIPLVAGPLCLAAPPRAVAQTPAQAQTTLRAQAPGEDAARRIVATLQLAANEYRLAWSNGAMTAPAEWEEAKEFVAEARRSAGELPPGLRAPIPPLVAGGGARAGGGGGALAACVLTGGDRGGGRGGKGRLAGVCGGGRGPRGGGRERAAQGEAGAAAKRVSAAYMAYETVGGSLRPADPGV